MAEWWSYTLSDFLLFSPRVYYRLLELHNRELWPANVLSLAAGLAVLGLALRPGRHGGRIAFALLGAAWLWVAWAFLWQRYATINWAIVYVAPLFVLEGLLLAWWGTLRPAVTLPREGGRRRTAGLALLAAALFGYPLLAPLMGRPWAAAESFAMMAEPTAVATLAVLALAAGRTRWALMAIPALWCGIAGATLWAMEAGDFAAAPLGAAMALAVAVRLRPKAAARR